MACDNNGNQVIQNVDTVPTQQLSQTDFSPRMAQQFNNSNNWNLSQQEEVSDEEQDNSTSTGGQGNNRRVNYACTECRKAHKACTGER